MAFAVVTFRHPIMRSIRPTPLGFSWTMLFFGIFVPLARSDWKHFLISTALAIFTSGLSWLVYPFWYNWINVRNVIKEGLILEHLGGATEKRFREYVGEDLAEIALSESAIASQTPPPAKSEPIAATPADSDSADLPLTSPPPSPAIDDVNDTIDPDDEQTDEFLWGAVFVFSFFLASIVYAIAVFLFEAAPNNRFLVIPVLLMFFELPLLLRFNVAKDDFPPVTCATKVGKWLYRLAYSFVVLAIAYALDYDAINCELFRKC